VFLTEPTTDYNLKANKGMQITSPYRMGWCAYLSNHWNIRMYTCEWGHSQMIYDSHWLFDKAQRIKLWYGRHRNRCWDHHMGNNNLFFGGCHNGNNQKWYFASRNTMRNRWRHGHACIDWHTGNHNLYMHRCHSGTNQQFWFNTGSLLKIKGGVRGNRRYMMWWSNGAMTFLWPKRNPWRNRQTLRFMKTGNDWYNIMATNCVYRGHYSVDNSYLSANSAGTKVDLWRRDDGSGRQRWKVKGPIAGGGYQIIVAAGVRGKRKFLSTNHHGNRIDLWIKDDNSGRQRWMLTGEFLPTPKPTPKPTPRPTPVPVKNLVKGGGWAIVKGKKKCTISIENGVKHPCAVSPNYPKAYPAEVKCEISMKKTKWVNLKGSSEKYFDYLTISGKQYSGKLSGKKLAVRGNLKWTADFFEATKGWKVCKGKKPRMRIVPKKKKYKIASKRAPWRCPRGYKVENTKKGCKAANTWWVKSRRKKDVGIGYTRSRHLGYGCFYSGNPNQFAFNLYKRGKFNKKKRWAKNFRYVCYKT